MSLYLSLGLWTLGKEALNPILLLASPPLPWHTSPSSVIQVCHGRGIPVLPDGRTCARRQLLLRLMPSVLRMGETGSWAKKTGENAENSGFSLLFIGAK